MPTSDFDQRGQHVHGPQLNADTINLFGVVNHREAYRYTTAVELYSVVSTTIRTFLKLRRTIRNGSCSASYLQDLRQKLIELGARVPDVGQRMQGAVGEGEDVSHITALLNVTTRTIKAAVAEAFPGDDSDDDYRQGLDALRDWPTPQENERAAYQVLGEFYRRELA